MDFLIILLVVFFFAFSIFIHEFGHLIAALWRGLYVEKFSIGFGPKIYGFKYKGIDFILSCLPLGGYVSLPQMIPDDKAPKDKNGNELAPIKPADKIITAVAGPLFNFIFAFILSLLVWQVGKPSLAPIDNFQVIEIEKGSPEYKAGVRKGDVINAINQEKFVDYQDLLEKFVTSQGTITLDLTRANENFQAIYKPDLNENYENLAYPFMRFGNPAIIGLIEKGGIADKAGLKNGDLIEYINNEKVHSLDDLEKFLTKFGSGDIILKIRRNEEFKTIKLLATKTINYRIGVFLESTAYGLKINQLIKEGAAEKAGIKKGDVIKYINGEEIKTVNQLKATLSSSKPFEIKVLRKNDFRTILITPEEKITYSFGANYHMAYLTAYPTPYEQFNRVITSTYRTLNSLFSPNSSVQVKHMSSVIGISKGLFDQIKILGIMAGVSFLILLNISLGILNLLPLPVLDGGHIVLAVVEKIIGREIPTKIIRPVLTIFAVLLMTFMFYVMYQDTLRLLK